MPPRQVIIPKSSPISTRLVPSLCTRCHYYATVSAVAPASPHDRGVINLEPHIQRHPSKQPPSHKDPGTRKSQLHRQYTSLLRSTPLMLLFQHNNLRANEWAAIRRELVIALRKAEHSSTPSEQRFDPAAHVKLQAIQTGIFAAALRVAEFYRPPSEASTHGLSKEAYRATNLPMPKNRRKGEWIKPRKKNTPLHAILSGPLALLTFPSVSPSHLAAALKILAPTQGARSAFPAPRRRDAPGYYQPATQEGLQKLLLLGARVDEGLVQDKMRRRVMDNEDIRWLGTISGGVDGLRGQLVNILQGAGMGLTAALEGAGKSLWATVEGRRMDLEGEGKIAGSTSTTDEATA